MLGRSLALVAQRRPIAEQTPFSSNIPSHLSLFSLSTILLLLLPFFLNSPSILPSVLSQQFFYPSLRSLSTILLLLLPLFLNSPSILPYVLVSTILLSILFQYSFSPFPSFSLKIPSPTSLLQLLPPFLHFTLTLYSIICTKSCLLLNIVHASLSCILIFSNVPQSL